MNRRLFLVGAAALAGSQGLAGCNAQPSMTLNIKILQNSIPPQVWDAFQQSLQKAGKGSAQLKLTPEGQLISIFQQLQRWQQATQKPNPRQGFTLPMPSLPFAWGAEGIADLVTLGDYWLETAIRQRLIQPLDVQQLPNWHTLPSRWQTLVRRNDQGAPDPQGKIWAAPYRWGTTVLAYRIDQFKRLGWTPTDWGDLWRSQLNGKISLLDQPREVIGLTLKKLGYSYNSPDLSQIPELKSQLHALHRQTKLYSSTAYLQPLLLGDTWLAVGWSTDILSAIRHNPNLAVVIPVSGTALWADLWVSPAPAQLSALAHNWIDFCWQPPIATQLTQLTRATSPILERLQPADIEPTLRKFPLLLPAPKLLERCEFLAPLTTATADQYRSLWQDLRRSPV
jgi:putative spermidine/putrescine transport system substrate-binding protein